MVTLVRYTIATLLNEEKAIYFFVCKQTAVSFIIYLQQLVEE